MGRNSRPIKEVVPVPVSFENIESGAKGFYHLEENRIVVQEGMSEAQTVKTLLLVLALLLSGRTLAKVLSSPRSGFSHQINRVRPSYHQYAFLLF